MRKKGVPEKYVMIVQNMYEGARTQDDYGCVGPRDRGSIPVVHVIC